MKHGERSVDHVRHAADKVADTLGGVAGKAKARSVKDADEFVENAALSDLYEIRSAELVLRRSRSEAVKKVAAQMIEDHTASTHQLSAALEMSETNGVKPPPIELDSRRTKLLQHIEQAPPDKLESTYLDQQVLAHQEALSLMKGYVDGGENPQLQSFAASVAPVIARHLEHMKSVRAEVK